jgi:transcriptional regulator with XRE-family HTH domain
MLGDRLKALREQRSWSQAHLADAAGVNVRTVQRIESGEPCSYETTLALAAALDIGVSQLDPNERAFTRPTRFASARIAVAAFCVLPLAVFVTVNLLRSSGATAPYLLLASTGYGVIRFDTFNAVSPIIFLGGAAITVALCLPTLIRFRGKMEAGLVRISGVELRARWLPLSLVATAVIGAGTLLAYVAVEQLRSPLS